MSNRPQRILGDQRIFQSVFNELDMSHELVTLADGSQRYAYVYKGPDPYNLEDSAFPRTVAALSLTVDEIIGRPLPVFDEPDAHKAALNQAKNTLISQQLQRKRERLGVRS